MRSPKRPIRPSQLIKVSVAAKNARQRGTSITETMLAALFLVIAMLGISSAYVSGRWFVVSQQYYQVAAQLASQKFEDLKSLGYGNIVEGEEQEELSVKGQSYQRRTQIELSAEPSAELPKPCFKAKVTIEWSLGGAQLHQASLVTYIGP
jgi:hypothetical protein